MSAAPAIPPDDERPLWADIVGAMPPQHRATVLAYLIEQAREAAEARAEAAALRPAPSRADRIRARNAAVVRALACIDGASASGRAKRLERRLRDYAANGWNRERDLAELPAGSSELRRALHEILRMNGGKPLGWTWLLRLSDGGLH